MSLPSLVLITPPTSNEVVARVRSALATPMSSRVAVLARRPGASARDLVDLAKALIDVCRARDAKLLVSDRADVARLVGADGVHLPEAGLTVAEAREVLGPGALVGVSRHDLRGVSGANSAGADYATLGPIHAVEGKNPPLGVHGFGEIAARAGLPLFALGGVAPRDVRALTQAGAVGVAVIRAVFDAEDPARAVDGLVKSVPRTVSS